MEEWVQVEQTERYCPVSKQWTTLMLSQLGCCQFSIAAQGSTLYLAGGGSLQRLREEDSIFLYNTEGQQWTKGIPLPTALVDHASCVIKLSQVSTAGKVGRDTKDSLAGRRKKPTLVCLITKRQEPHSASEEK